MTAGVMSSIRVLVVESNTLFRGGLEAVLSASEGLSVIAAVPRVDLAIHLIERDRPDVVVFGIDEREGDVDRSLARLLAVDAGQRIVILGQADRLGRVECLLQHGVRGYLPKDVSRDHLTSVVREVCREEERVFISASRAAIPSLACGQPVLSKREKEVILLVAEAMSNAQIARKLSITKGTVKRHLHNIFAKLDAVSRMDAVNKARSIMLIATAMWWDY